LPAFAKAQSRQIESVYRILQQATNDTVRMQAYSMLGGFYDDINSDSGLYYCNKGISIAEKLDLPLNKTEMLAFMAWPLMKTGNYPEALKVINQGFKIIEDPSIGKKAVYLQQGQTQHMHRLSVVGLLYSALESLYGYVGDYEKQIAAAREAIPHVEAAGDTINLAGIYPDIGDGYLKLNKFDSALFYLQKSLEYHAKLFFEDRKFEGSTYTSIGTIYEKTGNTDLARENYKKAIQVSELHDNPRHSGNACLQLASLYQSFKKADSSFLYAKKALDAFKLGGYKREVAMAYRMISDYYWVKENKDSSFAYLRLATALDDSLDKTAKTKLQEFQVAAFNQQLSLQQLEQEQIEKEGKLKTIAIIALIVVFSMIGFLLYRNNRQKQKANHILQEKNNQVAETLRDLKATQKQLIQSEKMASLGEVTAGIAHEIQNPLNFVNNFSEVNQELANELDSELAIGNEQLAIGNLQQAIDNWQKSMFNVQELIGLIKDNSEKINQHGQRASSIVKGMLEHSRKSSGVKEPTDINKLCDEFIRLSYQGFRAKDKSFNCDYKLDLDPNLPLVNVVAQDIGRVILNIVNNAFQACSEKQQLLNNKSESDKSISYEDQASDYPSALQSNQTSIKAGGGGKANDSKDYTVLPPTPKGEETSIYKPLVVLTSKFSASLRFCEICITDNGPGISDNIKDKIFQPFFTTKPTGQGTGLGLSLAYDIVKAQGGTLEVKSTEGDGSEFIITLPFKDN